MYVIVPALRRLEQEAGLGNTATHWPPQPSNRQVLDSNIDSASICKAEKGRCQMQISVLHMHMHPYTCENEHTYIHRIHKHVHKENTNEAKQLAFKFCLVF